MGPAGWALSRLREGGLLDVAQVGELLLEVRVALRLDLALVGRLACQGESWGRVRVELG